MLTTVNGIKGKNNNTPQVIGAGKVDDCLSGRQLTTTTKRLTPKFGSGTLGLYTKMKHLVIPKSMEGVG